MSDKAPQISFYHLTKTNLEDALPKLVEKILSTESRAVVLTEENKVEIIDKLLWSVGGRRFIPHFSEKDLDGKTEDEIALHPVYVTSKEENANLIIFSSSGLVYMLISISVNFNLNY